MLGIPVPPINPATHAGSIPGALVAVLVVVLIGAVLIGWVLLEGRGKRPHHGERPAEDELPRAA